MQATITRDGDQVVVDFIPDEHDYVSENTKHSEDGRYGQPAQMRFRLRAWGKHQGRYEVNGADLAGWCSWIFLKGAGLVDTIDLGPATYGDTLILLSEEALRGL